MLDAGALGDVAAALDDGEPAEVDDAAGAVLGALDGDADAEETVVELPEPPQAKSEKTMSAARTIAISFFINRTPSSNN